jgi:hypothetical protein
VRRSGETETRSLRRPDEELLLGSAVSFAGIDTQLSPVGFCERRTERVGGVNRERVSYGPAPVEVAVYMIYVSS